MSDTDQSDHLPSPIHTASSLKTLSSLASSISSPAIPPSASSSGSSNPPSAAPTSGPFSSPSSPASDLDFTSSSAPTPVSASSSSSKSSASSRRRKNKARARTAGSITSTNSDSSTGSDLPVSAKPLKGSLDGRQAKQDAMRYAALYAFPALLAVTMALLQRLATINIIPLYNSTPLRLHTAPLYFALGVLPTVSALGAVLLSSTPLAEIINPRVCLTLMALSADINLVSGRRIGSLSGYLLGPRWGALLARWCAGALGIWAGAAFTLLCLSHALPGRLGYRRTDPIVNGATALGGCFAFMAHVFYAEKAFQVFVSVQPPALAGGPVINHLTRPGSFISSHPEKSILVISLFLTALSLFVRSPRSDVSFAEMLQKSATKLFKLSPPQSRSLSRFTARLPRSVAPLLFLLRIPLLILAIRQQVFLRPSPPYIAANGTLRVLHSTPSLSGQIVVADNLAAGYRFLRCDGSLLGGRWTRESQNGAGLEFGDSIFAAFVLQEAGILASRSNETDSLARTISLTTDLEIAIEEDDPDARLRPRALIIGLGVGISASALSRRGYAVDVVEIDPAVYQAAVDHFDFHLSGTDIDTINIMPGQEYVKKTAEWDVESREKGEGGVQRWSYVIHDCFSAGSLPVDVYTVEFWKNLTGLVEDDGIVAVNVAGVMGSVSARRIVVTLLSVFEQCRAFGEMGNEQESTGLMNMVVLCTMAYSPLLSFRPPMRQQIMRSPARSHMYANFLQREISLDAVILPADLDDEEMLITVNGSTAGMDQIPTALATWRAMQTILTREMWLVW